MRRDFETMSMKDFESIDLSLTQVIRLVNQIRSHDEILEDRRIVKKILKILSIKFESIVVTIEETKIFSQFYVDEF